MIFRKRSVRRGVMFILDCISLLISFVIAWHIRFGSMAELFNSERYRDSYSMILSIMVILYAFVFVFVDGHHPAIMQQGRFTKFVSVLENQIFLLSLLVLVMYLTYQSTEASRYVVGYMFLINTFLDYIIRLVYSWWLVEIKGTGYNAVNLMLLTVSDKVEKIVENFTNSPELLTQISCITIIDKDMVGEKIAGIPVVGNAKNYINTHRENVYDEVMIALPYEYPVELKKMISRFEDMGVVANLSIEVFNKDASVKHIRKLGDYHVVSFAENEPDSASLLVKRIMDICGALIGLIICGIALIFVGPIIKITSPGPLFFSQTRIGINGRRFKMYKLRSMYADAEKRKKELMAKNEMSGLMFKMENDPRITPIGKFIRKTSIDELPQFFNVLMGDMSLVGTRPPTEDEYLQYKNYHMRRLSIKPGITGMWQVSGRSDIKDFEEVVRLDLEYIDNWSILLDIRILFQTVWMVIFGRGAK